MIDKELLSRVLAEMLGGGGSFAEIYTQKNRNNSLKLEDSKIENAVSGFDLGCGLRLWRDDSIFYAYVDSVKKKDLLDAARALARISKSETNARSIEINANQSLGDRSLVMPSAVDNDYKKNLLLKVDKVTRDYSQNIAQVSAYISDSEQEIHIANSNGVSSYFTLQKVILSVSAIAKRKKEIRTGHKSYAKTLGYEIFEQKKPEDVALEAAATAVKMLEARGAPTGEMPVVIGPAFGGVIFHEACGHGLEADAVIKDASVFKGKIGKKIASDVVTAIDDPSLKGHWGYYGFDDEGCRSSETVLIKDGCLMEYMHDLKSAVKLNQSQTGNGRRQSYRYMPYPRMSNTYIANGKSDPKDILGSVNRGIYAKEFAGGQVDPATGDFVFGISEGYMVENGKIAYPIKGATLIGNGPQVLKKIEMVGNDLAFAPGFCGKNGQSLANEVGQPTIKVSNMTVGGTET
ncbi:MAG: TldD/PmbA family protein [Actinomycetia bacterium]|nr:TldD/PmbA family protein [Actinomycetes bacterium]